MKNLNPVRSMVSRRAFCTAVVGAVTCRPTLTAAESEPAGSRESQQDHLYKAVKITMVKGDLPLLEKFRIVKAAGFDGISLTAPDQFDVKEAVAAKEKTGLIIHDVVNAVHWQKRLSDPDPAIRQQSLDAMLESIRFSHAIGAASVLQVVGKVTDPIHENHDQVWQRSIEAIRQAIPLASKLGVRILCENVGNGFCEDAQQWADYLDEIDDPWVGAFFDIGNHHSRGGATHWIRTLGSRIVKLDVKGHDSKIKKNCDTLDGDIDWPAVRSELSKLRFIGWATAEVAGGDAERLRQVAQQMDEALGLSQRA